MLKKLIGWGWVLALCGSAAAAPVIVAAPDYSQSIQVVRNLTYAPNGDYYHQGDLYLPPPGKSNHAAVIVVHGGAWIGGNKRERGCVAFCTLMAGRGYTAYSINYRLVGHGGEFPEDIGDVKEAVGFFMERAARWGVMRNRVAIAGDSAGAHLALMAAYTPDSARFAAPDYPHLPARLRAVISFYGPTESRGASKMGPLQREILLNYLGAAYEANPAVYREASPLTYADRAVPTFLAHGTADALVPVTQSKELYAALRQRHIPAELVLAPGAPHGFTNYPGSRRDLAFGRAIEFLDRVLLPHTASLPHPSRRDAVERNRSGRQ